MRKLTVLEVIRYADFMVDLAEYLIVFPGAKANDKIYDTELNEIVLNSTTNICIR